MYLKDKNGKRYEYRQKLEKYEGQFVELEAKISKFGYRGCCKQAELVEIRFNNGYFVCHHIHSDVKNNKIAKIVEESIGKKIKFVGKCKKYTNKAGQTNYDVDIREIVEIR